MSHLDSIAKPKHKDKLNLYLIGRSPDVKYLERLLSQVKSIVKTISFICTDNENDCLEVIKASGIDYQFDRMVFPKREDFDFSKARNRALELASKNEGWLFWLDCDDTIKNPDNIISQMEANSGKDCYGLPYNVNESSGNLWKIRIHKANQFYWVNRVHEELMPLSEKPNDVQCLILSDCPVYHSPDDGKSNHDFHISLLKKDIKQHEADYCYISKEYFNSCRYEEAIEWINKTIPIHSYPHEIYNLYVMLGNSYRLLDKFDKAVESFTLGINHSPYRKECYYCLAEMYGTKEDEESLWKGLGYIRACVNQLDKKEPLQNSLVYGDYQYKLEAMYLNKFNNPELALKSLDKVKDQTKEVEEIREQSNKLIEQKANK
mgnify:CR=1 FL=1